MLRCGVLGTARFGDSFVPLVRAAGQRVVTVASRSEERARECAARWEVERWSPSYEALLADPEIDVVYIPLPNALHVDWTLRAIEAGKHVLCEKPLALDPADVDRIAAAHPPRAWWCQRRSPIAPIRLPQSSARSSATAQSAHRA